MLLADSALEHLRRRTFSLASVPFPFGGMVIRHGPYTPHPPFLETKIS